MHVCPQMPTLTIPGLSDKPLTEYNAEVWRAQLAAFLQEVVGVGGPMGASQLNGAASHAIM